VNSKEYDMNELVELMVEVVVEVVEAVE